MHYTARLANQWTERVKYSKVPLSACHHRPRHGLGSWLPCKQVTATWGMGCHHALEGYFMQLAWKVSHDPTIRHR